MKSKVLTRFFSLLFVCMLIQACSTTKFVPDGQYLLSEAKVTSDAKNITNWEMRSHIMQKPNFKTFEIFKVPLTIYNLSGSDTSKWVNRTLRRAGEAPVIYDSTQVDQTIANLTQVMMNKGYVNARIEADVKLNKKKARIEYRIKANEPYRINDYRINLNDSVISKYDTLSYRPRAMLKKRFRLSDNHKFNMDTVLGYNSLVKERNIFDLDVLDKERDRITYLLRRTGYYALNKGHVEFVADSTIGQNKVDIELNVKPFIQKGNGEEISTAHLQYEIVSIDFYIDYNPIEIGSLSNYKPTETYQKDGYRILYGERGRYIKPHVLLEKCFIRPNTLYDEEMTALTYSALAQLSILKNINIAYEEYWDGGKNPKLHCIITCVPDKKMGIKTEVEGTNSGGFFGLGAGLGYSHKNIFRGSEQFYIGAKGAYEAITPSFTDFSNNYFEFGGETSLSFPRFMVPFLNRDFRKQVQASTQLHANYTMQRRPGFFDRTILAAGLKYSWNNRRNTLTRHTIDFVDVSYAHIPKNKLDSAFYHNLSAAAQRYSFEDQFIMSTGYTYTTTNGNLKRNNLKPIYALRASVETAGNLLGAVAQLTKANKGKEGSREVFGTQFAQYARATADYSRTYYFDEKNSFAWHIGGGIAYPYGNFKQIPIQKRFFSGGANNVRGWAVRELGPGSFRETDIKNEKKEGENNNESQKRDNFFYHSGDIRLDANIEYRSKLFWIVEMAAFIDAGNIWTAKSYEDQPNGEFKLNQFYKEIALSWGLGMRLDFDFVLIRLDCGWKAYDPGAYPADKDKNIEERVKWPIGQPFRFGKNTAWHIAVGYPF